jgi:hypothetical protein
MDLGFLRRAEQRFASRAAARVDFGMLIAALKAQQASSPAARAQAALAAPHLVPDPLVEILLAGPCWRQAVAAQGGRFHRAPHGNGSSIEMKGAFTLRFQPSFNGWRYRLGDGELRTHE